MSSGKITFNRRRFAVFLPRLDLDSLESGIRVKEGLSQICPDRITVEVGGVKLIPGRIVLVASKAAARIVARFDRLAGRGLEYKLVRRKTSGENSRREKGSDSGRRPVGCVTADCGSIACQTTLKSNQISTNG
jgi:hypothetical protein